MDAVRRGREAMGGTYTSPLAISHVYTRFRGVNYWEFVWGQFRGGTRFSTSWLGCITSLETHHRPGTSGTTHILCLALSCPCNETPTLFCAANVRRLGSSTSPEALSLPLAVSDCKSSSRQFALVPFVHLVFVFTPITNREPRDTNREPPTTANHEP